MKRRAFELTHFAHHRGPASWTTPRLMGMLPPRAADAPRTPSLPTIAASISSPDERPTTRETIAPVGKVDVSDFTACLEQNPLVFEVNRFQVTGFLKIGIWEHRRGRKRPPFWVHRFTIDGGQVAGQVEVIGQELLPAPLPACAQASVVCLMRTAGPMRRSSWRSL